MTNKGKLLAMILAICFIAYNVTIFIICGFGEHTAVFWTSWIFMILAFTAMAVAGVILKQRGMFLRDWLFGFPIIKHSTVYLIAEFITSTVFIILEKIAPWSLAIVLQFLFLCIYSIFAVSCFLAKETIDEVRTKVNDKTRFTKLLLADVQMLVMKCTDPALRGQLQKLSEQVRYSDPMSSESLFELEKEITLTVSQCDEALMKDDLETAESLCQKAELLLCERNKKCKVLK